MSQRALVVSLHDVSPQTHAAAARIVDELEQLGVTARSLLVIPDHHGRGSFLADEAFCGWLRERRAAGDEIVAHGYRHLRPRRADETLPQKLTTRIYTADEGEFYDLDFEDAAALLAKIRAEFTRAALTPIGFIAPAWLLSETAEAALRADGWTYTTRLASVLDLQGRHQHPSRSLVWSVRSAWRRHTSLIWNAFLFRTLRNAELLRISVHPVDLNHSSVWRQIRGLIARALEDRESVTYASWVVQKRESRAVRTQSDDP